MAAPARQSAPVTTVSSTTNSTTFSGIGLATGTAGRHTVRVSSRSTGLLTASTGWKKIGQRTNGTGMSIAVFWSDTATSLTITSATSTQFSAVATRDPDYTTPYLSPLAAFGTSTNPNPPAINMIRARDHRFESLVAIQGTSVPTSANSGYSSLTTQAGGGANGVGFAYMEKATTASATEDPPALSWATSTTWLSVTLGFYSWDADRLSYWKGLLASPTKNPIALGVGTSLMAGALNNGAGGNTMGSNAFATSRPWVWAANLTALPASVWMAGIAGIVTATASEMNDYNNRFSAGASFTTSDQAIGAFAIGKGARSLNTSGQKMSEVIQRAFDRVKVRVIAQPGGVTATIDVNGGTPQTITALNGTLGYAEQTFNLSGSAGATVNITGAGANGFIVGIEAWSTSAYQVQFFNAGWYGGSSADMANSANVYNSLYGIAAFNSDLLLLEPNANDGSGGAGLTQEQSEENLRSMILAGKGPTGDVFYSMFPYSATANEASEDAAAVILEAVCDQMGAYFFNIHTQPNWTSRNAMIAAGYTDANDVHQFAAGYAAWGELERQLFDLAPPVQNLTAPLLTNSQTFYSPTVTRGTISLSPPILTNANSLYAPTVTPGAVTLSPPLYSNANAFYAPTVTPGAVSLSPGLLTNTSTLYAPVVSQGGITLAPPLLSNTNTLFAPTITQASGSQSLIPPRLDNVNGFFAPTVTPGAVTFSPPRLTNVSTLYPPTVIQPGAAQLLQPGLLQNTSVLFAPAVANDNAPGTYPLAIEGGGTVVLDILTGTATVVGGTITFTGRVVAGALRGRP